MGTLNIRLSSEDEAVLHQIASANHVSDSEAAAAGLRAYLKFEADQIAKIRAGLKAADRGDFALDDDMAAFFATHGAGKLMRLRWTLPARDHLTEIHAYLTQRNPAAARRVIAQVRKDAELLKTQPGMGRPGRIEGTREMLVSHYPYIIAYRIVAPEEIHILAIIHTARLWPDQMA